ncbi:MerR family transcriptional regulator [Pedobacter boryungensis]|uniref:MerR family transcriptional regulator n=1 Tax=Pedobacter boryungensis TaxID=869962 RepID=A0ABX2D979_9SPHI|nr:MerR family transcriptional regulator [Pedobacter boryungensis]NQX30618.1 MerR family transcriptional regulator [Pedobacter boryungensis]
MKLSISNLEQLSGVSIHTIRIWERRYHALEPQRSSGGTRFYTDQDLKRLLNIVSLQQAGVKISQACSLSAEEMDELLAQDLKTSISSDANHEFYISQLLKAGVEYDEPSFTTLLDRCINDCGMLDSYKEVIFPLMQRLGLMWRLDHICPAHEHFISAIVRQKLMSAINSIPIANQKETTWLLFLPEDEGHDIPLLFANFILRSHGVKVVYLGERVPMDSIVDAQNTIHAENLLFFMVRQRPIKEAADYLAELARTFTGSNIYLAGNGKLIGELQLPANVTWFSSISSLTQILNGENG